MSIEVGTVGALLNQARQKVRDCFEVQEARPPK
jgi:DNA-directed RNA polymerase specialized sigma24 family protein